MSGNGGATRMANRSVSPLLTVIRWLATCVVVMGILQGFLGLPETLMGTRHMKEGFFGTLAWILSSLSGPFRFAALGAIAYVVTQISFGRRKRRLPFDFHEILGKYIEYERPSKALNRWIFGGVCLVGGPFLSLVGNWLTQISGRSGDPVLLIVLFVGGIAILFVSMLVFLTGLRSIAPRAETMLRRDRRRPILYLRSFKSDAGLFDRGNIGSLIKMLFFGPLANQTTEQALALAVKDFRPLVAIGQPSERLPPLGAARLYVSGDDWQNVVANLVDSSTLVILRMGSTEGFWWEMEHLVKTCDPRKILIYLPPRDRGVAYQMWRTRAATHVPHILPGRVGQAMFLAFLPNWQPYLLGERGPSLGAWSRRLFGGRAAEIREALNHHLRKLGANPTRLPLLAREWFLLTLFFVFTLFVVIPLLR